MEKKSFSSHKLWPAFDQYLKALTGAVEKTGLKTDKNAKNYIRGFVFAAVGVSYLHWPGGDYSVTKQAEIDEWLELLFQERGFKGPSIIMPIKLTNWVALPQHCLGEDYARIDEMIEAGRKYEDLRDENIWEHAWINFSANMFGREAEAGDCQAEFIELMGRARNHWPAG